MTKYASILETVGNTPVVKINKLAPPNVNLYVKIEAFNPLGSVKDRLALGVIEDGERSGKLKPGQTVVEAILHRAQRIESFDLDVKVDVRRRELVDLYDGSVADGLENAGVLCHGRLSNGRWSRGFRKAFVRNNVL
jgi:hypothetical protein